MNRQRSRSLPNSGTVLHLDRFTDETSLLLVDYAGQPSRNGFGLRQRLSPMADASGRLQMRGCFVLAL
jgi:hypothetical protein